MKALTLKRLYSGDSFALYKRIQSLIGNLILPALALFATFAPWFYIFGVLWLEASDGPGGLIVFLIAVSGAWIFVQFAVADESEELFRSFCVAQVVYGAICWLAILFSFWMGTDGMRLQTFENRARVMTADMRVIAPGGETVTRGLFAPKSVEAEPLQRTQSTIKDTSEVPESLRSIFSPGDKLVITFRFEVLDSEATRRAFQSFIYETYHDSSQLEMLEKDMREVILAETERAAEMLVANDVVRVGESVTPNTAWIDSITVAKIELTTDNDD